MSAPDDREPSEVPAPEPAPRAEPFLFKIVRSAIAPDVLDDGGHDAPLTPRGRILFWGTVGALGLAIAVLFVLTLAK